MVVVATVVCVRVLHHVVVSTETTPTSWNNAFIGFLLFSSFSHPTTASTIYLAALPRLCAFEYDEQGVHF